jgi:putative oxidoreductase
MKTTSRISQHAHWFLRIAIASSFLFHGITKFPDLNGTAEMMGLPGFILLLVALAETVGALLILLGGFYKNWMTKLGALMNLPVMLGAIFMFHWGRWSFTPSETHPMGGIEFPVIMTLILLYLLFKENISNKN